MTIARFFCVPGTFAWGDDPNPALPRNWWRPGSPLLLALGLLGLESLCPEDPYRWSTELGGVRFYHRWPWFRSRRDHRCWHSGADGQRWWMIAKGIPLADRRALVHSHGLQPTLYAAADWHEPMYLERLISVGSPLRADMRDVVERARPRIRRWLHVTDDADRIQRKGLFGDGEWGLPDWVDDPQLGPDTYLVLPGIGHSRLLQDPQYFDLWVTRGLAAFLSGQETASVLLGR